MKNIFCFIHQSRASVYGIGTYIRELTNCLSSVGYNCHVVHLNAEKEEFTVEQKECYKYYYIPDKSFLSSKKSLDKMYYKSVAYLMAPYIEHTAHTVFQFNFAENKLLIEYLGERYPLIKKIFTIHYFNWCFHLSGNDSYFYRILNRPFVEMDTFEKGVYESYQKELQVFQQMDKIICLSKYAVNLLTKAYNVPLSKIDFIPNGIADEYLPITCLERKELKETMGFTNPGKILLYAGRLDEIKGIHFLLDAFRKVITSYPDCYLVIVGEGAYSTYMKQAKGLWGQVIFTGKLEKEDLYKIYRIADVGIIPSMHEQCSYVAIEMMMSGLPMIVTTSTGLSEMVKHEENGIKLNIKERKNTVDICVNEFKDALLKMLISSSERERIGYKSRETYLKVYTLERMQNSMKELINTL